MTKELEELKDTFRDKRLVHDADCPCNTRKSYTCDCGLSEENYWKDIALESIDHAFRLGQESAKQTVEEYTEFLLKNSYVDDDVWSEGVIERFFNPNQ